MSKKFLAENPSSWQRTIYDHGTYRTDLHQSVAPMYYTLDPHRVHRCQPVRPMGEGWHTNQGVSYDASRPLVDSESDLKNINRKLSRDPQYKYQPMSADVPSEFVPQGYVHFPENAAILHEYSQLSHSSCGYRELGVNRFHPLYFNPQERHRWEHPGALQASSRLIHKDQHRCIIPKPLDPTPALPDPENHNCKTVPVTPSYVHYKHVDGLHPLAHTVREDWHEAYTGKPRESILKFGINRRKCG